MVYYSRSLATYNKIGPWLSFLVFIVIFGNFIVTYLDGVVKGFFALWLPQNS